MPVLLSAVALAGCGSESQDENEKNATYTVTVPKADFPARQSLSQSESMVIDVKNAGEERIPLLAITVQGFRERIESETTQLADPSRPVWIIDRGPEGGESAFTNTWYLKGDDGKGIDPGETQRFEWRATPVRSGRFELSYTVAAGLDGKGKAELPGGRDPEGNFAVDISETPPASRVDPETGRIIRPDE